MTKRLRHEAILKLVRKQPAESQETLKRELLRQGIEVTQATLSRDIAELGLVKTPDGYCLPTQLGSPPHNADGELRRMLREFLTEAIPAGNVVVIKTPPGAASALGGAVDRAALPEIVGTLAGDDIILAITKTPAEGRKLARRIKSMV